MAIKIEYLKRLAKLAKVDLSINDNGMYYFVNAISDDRNHFFNESGFNHNFQSDTAPKLLSFIRMQLPSSTNVFYLIEMTQDFISLTKGKQYLLCPDRYNGIIVFDDDGKTISLWADIYKIISVLILKKTKLSKSMQNSIGSLKSSIDLTDKLFEIARSHDQDFLENNVIQSVTNFIKRNQNK